MKQTLTAIIVLLLFSFSLQAQEKYTIKGYVKDASSGEAIIGATVSFPAQRKGTYTNAYGFYSITLPAGKYEMLVKYIGYEPLKKEVDLNADMSLNLEIKETSVQTEEITVSAEAEDINVKSIQMSTNKISTETIVKLPALLGEADVINSIQLLPGVTSVGEGSSGFNVRGGGVDQNLVLLDEAPVFNSSHLFGFFSVFNPDAVKDVQLIKGGIPSVYGGRLSSILDVRLKEGNNKEFEGSGGIGAIFSRISFEGPIVENKASFLVAARRSYIDILAKPFLSDGLSGSVFNFYDLTAKTNWIIDENNTVFASGYFGRDAFGSTGFGFNWGSQTLSFRWNHLFSDKLFSNLTYYYSNYDYEIRFGEDEFDEFRLVSHITTQSIKNNYSYFYDAENKFEFGIEAIHYDFEPGTAYGASGGFSLPITTPDKFAFEYATYLNYQLDLNNFSMKAGLRASGFSLVGPTYKYTYNDTTAGLERTLISKEQFEDFDPIESFLNLEPRIAINYVINDESSVKLSYNRMNQYIHLLSNTAAPTPLDLWTPSTNNIPAQRADQYAVGYFRNFDDNAWETSAEVYYKDLSNQVEYRTGADLGINEEFEADLLIGEGRAYGLELYIEKKKGDFTGWISYTLSRTERKVDGVSMNEWFPARFDKTHNLSVTGFYQLTDTWELSSNFVFNTGRPATFPTNGFNFQGIYVPNTFNGLRNSNRVPSYHRLDFSVIYTPEVDPDDWWDGQWVFSIYNLYNRRNAFSVYPDLVDGVPQTTQLSIIGSIIPSISYNFNF